MLEQVFQTAGWNKNLLSEPFKKFVIKCHILYYIKDYISGCVNFSFNCQSVSFLQAYLLLELSSSSLLAGTGGDRRQLALWYLVVTVWSMPTFGVPQITQEGTEYKVGLIHTGDTEYQSTIAAGLSQ